MLPTVTTEQIVAFLQIVQVILQTFCRLHIYAFGRETRVQIINIIKKIKHLGSRISFKYEAVSMVLVAGQDRSFCG